MRVAKILATVAMGVMAFGTAKAELVRNGENLRVIMKMKGAHYRGVNTIKLRQEIKNLHPRINLSKFELVRVRLKAKSKHGNDYASLLVGKSAASRWQVVDGNRRDFRDSGPSTYPAALVFENPSYYSQGRWQLELDGNIKVQRIAVVLKRIRGNNGGNNGNRGNRNVLMDVSCSSFSKGYSTCSVGAGTIVDARIRSVSSKAACVRGRSWGVRSNYIWVDRGCRGTFRVTVNERRADRDRRDRRDEDRADRRRDRRDEDRADRDRDRRERDRERRRRDRRRRGN